MNQPKLFHEAIEDGTERDWKRYSIGLQANRQRFFVWKNLAERCLGTLMLVVLAPLIGVLWLAVRLTSRGPGFYRQTRVGLDGKTFQIVKLRSMRIDAEKDGPVWATRNDTRTTPLGKFLRKVHLDELPQLINVAAGDMGLVGPRPERPEICEELELHVPGYCDRHCVLPGITGLAQINLPPDETLDDVHRKQIMDLYYIDHANSWLEFRILLATALRIVGIKGASVMRWMGLCRMSVLDEMRIDRRSESRIPVSKVRGGWQYTDTMADEFETVGAGSGIFSSDSDSSISYSSESDGHKPR